MKRTVLWALGALNVILLASLLAPFFGQNEAMAQRAGGGGRRPELMMIPGDPIGSGGSGVVYLIDTANRRLGVISLNQKGTGLDSLAPEDLDRVFADRDAGNGGNPKGGKVKPKP
jgi:hypothetical protein